MKKSIYKKPAVEVIELTPEDIIKTSGLTESVGSVSGGNSTGTSSSYDDAYNLSAGGKITLQ